MAARSASRRARRCSRAATATSTSSSSSKASIEVFDVDEHDRPQVFLVLRSRQFTGELDLFNERAVLVSARAGEPSRLLRVERADFRRLVSTEADIGEIVMRAFILRRVGLIRHVHGGVVVVGPAHSADTCAWSQFLSRNAYPHRLVDTEHDAGGRRLPRLLLAHRRRPAGRHRAGPSRAAEPVARASWPTPSA